MKLINALILITLILVLVEHSRCQTKTARKVTVPKKVEKSITVFYYNMYLDADKDLNVCLQNCPKTFCKWYQFFCIRSCAKQCREDWKQWMPPHE